MSQKFQNIMKLVIPFTGHKEVLSLHENFSKNILSCNKHINELNNTITEIRNKNLELIKKLKLENIKKKINLSLNFYQNLMYHY